MIIDLIKLIHPLTPSVFFSTYWECQTHLSRALLTRSTESLLSIDLLEEILSLQRFGSAEIKMFRLGAGPVNSPDLVNTDGVANLASIGQLYARGFTLVVNELRYRRPELGKFCQQLERELGHHVDINGYLTPPSAQGLSVHFDSHDVFVIQIAGSKSWRIYEKTVDAPLAEQAGMVYPGAHAATEIEEFVLHPGDIAYIPGGFPHEVSNHEKSPSLHLTVGIFRTSWLDVALKALKLAALSESWLRKAVPPPVAILKTGPESSIFQKVGELFNQMDPRTAIAELTSEVHRFAAPGSYLSSLDSISEMNQEWILLNHVHRFCRVLNGERSTTIFFPGAQVSIDSSLTDAAEFICRHERFKFCDIPLGDNSQRLPLVSKLTACGLLTWEKNGFNLGNDNSPL